MGVSVKQWISGLIDINCDSWSYFIGKFICRCILQMLFWGFRQDMEFQSRKILKLSGHLPNLALLGHKKTANFCVTGGGCGRLAKCTGTYLLLSRGTTEVVGGTWAARVFLAPTSWGNPDIVLTAVWLVETCRFSNNFGKFLNLFNPKLLFFGTWCLQSFEFPGFFWRATCFPIHPSNSEAKEVQSNGPCKPRRHSTVNHWTYSNYGSKLHCHFCETRNIYGSYLDSISVHPICTMYGIFT